MEKIIVVIPADQALGFFYQGGDYYALMPDGKTVEKAELTGEKECKSRELE